MKFDTKSYKRLFFIISITLILFAFSCNTKTEGKASRFRSGIFEIPEGKGYSKTVITRIDSLQIEEYIKFTEISTDSGILRKETKRIDTLFIKWKNNFFYTLKMKSPKNDLDEDPIFVQITHIKDASYDFFAKIGFSEFKQKGTVYKVQ